MHKSKLPWLDFEFFTVCVCRERFVKTLLIGNGMKSAAHDDQHGAHPEK
jgi:hypothetical protein